MEPVVVSLDPAWIAGLLLAIIRVGAFVVASPLLSHTFPPVGRLAFTVAIGASMATTVDSAASLSGLLSAAFMNVMLGLALGWLTGLIFHLFSITGGIVDFGSGLAVSQAFDPQTGVQAAVFQRWFPLTASGLFVVSGGLPLVVGGLDRSVRAVPLDGSVVVHGDLLDYVARQVSELMLAGLELALPLAATLLVAEVLLGMASRLVPQFPVFLLGLPAKIWISLTVVAILIMRFPIVVTNVIEMVERAFGTSLRGLGG